MRFEDDAAPGGFHRPYAPMHGPGCDPYQLVEYVPDVVRRTNFRGEVSDD